MLSLRTPLACTFLLASLWVAPIAAQTTHVVTLQGTTFSPQDITIAVGDTVQWDWISGFHSVTSGLGGSADGIFTSGLPVPSPNTFSLTFDQAFLDANSVVGKRYDYFCDVHVSLGMVGSVTVDVPAGGVSRNAGSNPTSLTLVSPPVIGALFVATQDLSLTGHSLGGLVGFAGPLTFPLAGGQTILVDVTNPAGELLGQGLQAGPLVNWQLAVPSDPALCGFTLSVQGLHLGGVTPFALSNALDLTVGS